MIRLKPETLGFVRGGMLFLEPPDRWRTWQRNIWNCSPNVAGAKGGPTEEDPDRPYCKPDQSCCDFCCGN